MASHQGRLYHCGAVAPKRSTFADANRSRDFRIFSGLFEAMLAQSGRGLRRKMADAVRLIDSTGLRLAGVGAQWARFSTGVFGAKAHVVYDPDLGRPVYHAVTAANVNDISAARDMPVEAGATYVFDLGYYDFAWWAKLDALGCRLVTRFKTNTPLNSPRETPLPPGSAVLSDRTGFLPARQMRNCKNPMQDAVREIVVKTETGQTLRLLTNDLDASAEEIADLYKRRWRIGFTSNGDEARLALTTPSLHIDVVLADMTTQGAGFALQRWVRESNHSAAVILAGSIEKAVDHAASVCKKGPALAKPYEHHLVLDHIRRAIAQRDRSKVA